MGFVPKFCIARPGLFLPLLSIPSSCAHFTPATGRNRCSIMATKSSSTPAPLTFDLDQSLVDKIEELRDGLGLSSTSEVVRLAVDNFNFDRFKAQPVFHRQISVRLPGDQRTLLRKAARAKKASIGELLRVAIEGLSEKPIKKASAAKKTARR